MSYNHLLVESSVIISISIVPFKISSTVVVVASNLMLSIVAVPASNIFLTCRKQLMLRCTMISSIRIRFVIIFDSELLSSRYGTSTSIVLRPPLLRPFVGNSEKNVIVGFSFSGLLGYPAGTHVGTACHIRLFLVFQ